MHLAKRKIVEIIKNTTLAAINLILTDRGGKILGPKEMTIKKCLGRG